MLLTLLTSLAVSGGATTTAELPVPKADLNAYAEVLSSHVRDGRVDYSSLAKKDLAKLDQFLGSVAKADLPSDRNLRIGFLIDAYNALVLRSVIQHGRPRSVLDVKGFFDKEKHTVAKRKVTLDALEKKVLNPFAKDPRTHFVLVCGAVGCPILEARPYIGTKVSGRMASATRRYLRSPHGARVSAGKIAISKIFDWYAADFEKAGGVKEFILNHLPAKARKEAGANPEIVFVEYNWTLNQQ